MLIRHFHHLISVTVFVKGVSTLLTAVHEPESNERRRLMVHLKSVLRGEKTRPSRHPLALGTRIFSFLSHPPSVEFTIWMSYIWEIETMSAFVVYSPFLFLFYQDDINQNNTVTDLGFTHLAISFACGVHS